MNTSATLFPAIDQTLLLRSALERIRLLEAEVLRLQPKINDGVKAIRIFHSGSLVRVPLALILYFKAESNYTRIYLTDGVQYYVSRTLKSWDDEIRECGFLRCHRSYMVNKDEIVEINRFFGEIRLKDGSLVPISRRLRRASAKSTFTYDHPQDNVSTDKPDCTVHKLTFKAGCGSS